MKSLKNILIRQIYENDIPKELKKGKNEGCIGKYFEPNDSEIPEIGTPLILYARGMNNDWVIFGKARTSIEEAKSKQRVEYVVIGSHSRGFGFIELTENFIEYFKEE